MTENLNFVAPIFSFLEDYNSNKKIPRSRDFIFENIFRKINSYLLKIFSIVRPAGIPVWVRIMISTGIPIFVQILTFV